VTDLGGTNALVTGASSGIGRAVALELGKCGVSVVLVARRPEALQEVADDLQRAGSRAWPQALDLCSDAQLDGLGTSLASLGVAIDILVHGAAAHGLGTIAETPVSQLDTLYRLNVRAPYVLTRSLLPQLRARRGQVVFVNSSVGLAARGRLGPYAATKHALRALADALRDEVNGQGVRVISVYLGRTATPGQEAIHAQEGKAYAPDRLLQPQDVARAIVAALQMPRTAEVTDIHVRPFQKP